MENINNPRLPAVLQCTQTQLEVLQANYAKYEKKNVPELDIVQGEKAEVDLTQDAAASHRRLYLKTVTTRERICFSPPADRSPVFGFAAHHMTSDSHTFLIISAQFTAVAQRDDYWSRPGVGKWTPEGQWAMLRPPCQRRQRGRWDIPPWPVWPR